MRRGRKIGYLLHYIFIICLICYYIVLELIQELRIQYPDIKGIGLSGQMHGILYVDAEGLAVSPLYTWQDMRGSLLYKDGISYAAYLSGQTGFPLSTGFGLVTHYYNKVN